MSVVVIGAGPAGSAAAITAARAGFSVTLIDKASFPRPKCCGDGLTTGCLRTLEVLGLDLDSVPSWKPIDDVILVGPNGKRHDFPLPRGNGVFAAVARREELDHALVQLAQAEGVQFAPNHCLEGITPQDDHVIVGAAHDGAKVALEAEWVIAADGMWSPSRKFLGHELGDYRGDWHAFRQYFSGVSLQAQNELICWFEPDIVPGYVWSFPTGDGAANVGFGILRGGPVSTKQMRALWPELLQRPHIASFLGPNAVPEARHTAWPIPARLGSLPLTDGRVFFVGDAAAATDPMSGEGIGQALDTGMAAALAISHTVHNLDGHVSTATKLYTDELRRGMQRDHALAHLLSKGLSNVRIANLALAAADATGWTRRNFARWLFEDYPRAVLGTPHRWQRGVFTSPGAFAEK